MHLALWIAVSLLDISTPATGSVSHMHGHTTQIAASVISTGTATETDARQATISIKNVSPHSSASAAGSISTDWYDRLLLISSSVHGPMTKHGVLPESRYNLKEFKNDTTFAEWLKTTENTRPMQRHISTSQQHSRHSTAQASSSPWVPMQHRHMLAQQSNTIIRPNSRSAVAKGAAVEASHNIAAGGFSATSEAPMSYKCGVFISHKYRFIFIRNRKGASSTVIKALNNNQPLRLTPGAPWYFFPNNERAQGRNPDTLWRDYFVFSTSRNPWSRAASAYDYSLSKWTHHNGSCLDPTFEEFCLDPMILGKTSAKYHCHPPEFKDLTHDFYHVEPAYHCLTEQHGRSAIDFVVRYEHMASDLKIAVDIINERKPLGTLPLTLPITILHKNKGTAKPEAASDWEEGDAEDSDDKQQEVKKLDPGPQDSFHQEHLRKKQQRRQQQRIEQRHRMRQEAEKLLTRSESHYGSAASGNTSQNASIQPQTNSTELFLGGKRKSLNRLLGGDGHSSGVHVSAEASTNITASVCDSSCVRAARYRACGRTCVQGIASFFRRDFEFFGFQVPD